MSFRRENSPPRCGPHLKIFRLKASKTGTFAIFGTQVHGFWTHWSGFVSEPCTHPTDDCVGHQREWPLRWKGYIHCHFQERGEEGFLELTPAASEDLLIQIGGQGELRGARVTVSRGSGDKSRLRIAILPSWKALTGRECPPEQDPEETLRVLWSFGRKGRKIENPTKGGPNG